MQYRFFDPGPERLIELSELTVDDGVAVAVLTTGYGLEEDEVLRLVAVNLNGDVLFDQTVKPQNVEEWQPSEASGGITPADVEDAPELYQFEEQLSDLLENAPVVVAQHLPFVEAMVESSWVTLEPIKGQDLIALFCETHSLADYPSEPASVAVLSGIAAYYDIEASDQAPLVDTARNVAACYRALVAECARERAEKSESYWESHKERMAEEAALKQRTEAATQLREKRFNQMNGLLWVAGGLIFVSLIIQLAQRGGDVGFMVVCGAAAVFSFLRAIASFRR